MRLPGWLLLTLVLQAGPPTPKALIEGVVVRADSWTALPGVQIDLVRFSASPSTDPFANNLITVTGDARGHFEIPNLNAGTYRVFATRNGFARSEYGQRTPNGRGVSLTIVDGQQIKDLTFRLQPAGTITGRVTGSDGEPLTGFSVELLRATYDSTGARVLRPNLTARTDDRGEYRIFWITPGKYYVSVNPQTEIDKQLDLSRQILLESGQPGGTPADGLANFGFINVNQVFSKQGYVATYYPNSTDRSAAQLLEIQPGTELGGINLQLVQQSAARIRGRVVAETGEPARDGEVTLRSRDGVRFYGGIRGDSNFEISNVTPGSYSVFASSAGGKATAPQIQVTGSNIDNLLLTIHPGVTVTGRLLLDGGIPPSEVAGFGRPRIELGIGDSESGRIRGDGTFTIADVPRDEYWVRVVNLPANWYLKDVRSTEADLMRAPLIVSNNAIRLEIEVSRKTGRLEGTVIDQRQQPVEAVEVTLIPDQPRERHELYRKAQTDNTGHFFIDELAPGDYKVFAWEDIEPFSYFDPAVLKHHEQSGTNVRVGEGSSSSVNVRLIPLVN